MEMKARTATIVDTATGLLVIPCSPAGDGVYKLESLNSIPGPACLPVVYPHKTHIYQLCQMED